MKYYFCLYNSNKILIFYLCLPRVLYAYLIKILISLFILSKINKEFALSFGLAENYCYFKVIFGNVNKFNFLIYLIYYYLIYKRIYFYIIGRKAMND